MKTVWQKQNAEGMKAIMDFNEGYRQFLSKAKTEREFVNESIKEIEKKGYTDFYKTEGKLKTGDKVYFNNRGKNLCMFVIGRKPLKEGLNILGAHIDSPRLDLKQHPLYEKDGLVLLDTHYYGGIKKYQWVTRPMALHGVVCRKDGTSEVISIGEDAGDPVVGITDLLIHLAAKQMKKTAAEVVEGEDLDVLIGSIPSDAEKDPVKDAILKLLKEKYNIEEDDFISAEIEVVPAGMARDFGLDRSMIMGYGHDDRVCAYTSMQAILDNDTPERTSCCILVDKEEIGSVGATGMHSEFFKNAVLRILDRQSEGSFTALSDVLENSRMLSSDVSDALDPLYADVNDPKNSAYFGCGICFNKYTGSRGKSGSNDANAEYVAKVRRVMDESEVSFQTCELGAVDVGGGGTIAYILAQYNMDVIDAGIAVLNMHAPDEIVSKADVYEGYRAYRAFLKSMN